MNRELLSAGEIYEMAEYHFDKALQSANAQAAQCTTEDCITPFVPILGEVIIGPGVYEIMLGLECNTCAVGFLRRVEFETPEELRQGIRDFVKAAIEGKMIRFKTR